jgi:hypothetical protein
MGDLDAEEVLNVAHVCHGKLGVEGGGDPVEDPSRGGGEDDVVDVHPK